MRIACDTSVCGEYFQQKEEKGRFPMLTVVPPHYSPVDLHGHVVARHD